MNRKLGQVTIFIAVGLVILMVASLALYLRMQLVETRVGTLEQQVELSSQRTSLKLMVDSCLRDKAVKGVELYGMGEDAERLITSFIEYEMLPCIDVSPFTEEGIRVYNEEGSVTTDISENAVSVRMHLPLHLVAEDSEATVEDFAFTLQKIRYVNLPTDQEGMMLEPMTVTTPNNRAELTIPAGVVVKKDGAGVSPEDLVSLRLVDRNYNNMQNAISIGEILYLMEKGVTFSPAATLTLYYDEDELPPWEDEEELTLSVYNDDTGVWQVLPAVVDTEKNRITAKVEHFSLFTITSSVCSDNERNYQTFSSGLVFKERCRPCDSPTEQKGNTLYFTTKDVKRYDAPTYPAFGTPNGLGCQEKEWGVKEEEERRTTEAICDNSYGGDYDPETGICTYEKDVTTYGYESAADVGGSAVFTFEVAGGGNACKNEQTVPVTVNISTGSDTHANELLNDQSLSAGNFQADTNEITFDVVNTNDACAQAEVTITVNGAGFLPECGVGEISRSCVCGQQNVKYDRASPLYCCRSGVTVDNPAKCTNASLFTCPNGFLGSADHGCFCNGQPNQQYNHYGGQNHYCCGTRGLTNEPCESCAPGVVSEQDEGCLCRGGEEAREGEVCCVIDSNVAVPLGQDVCPAGRWDGAGCGGTESSGVSLAGAAIADITGRAIEASNLCAPLNVGDAPSGFWGFVGNLVCPGAQYDENGVPLKYNHDLLCDTVVSFAMADRVGDFNNCVNNGWDVEGDGVVEYDAKACFNYYFEQSQSSGTSG